MERGIHLRASTFTQSPDRRCAYDVGAIEIHGIGGQRIEDLLGPFAAIEGDQGRAILPAPVGIREPRGNLSGSPFGRLLGVAGRTGIRCACGLGLQRIGLAEEVVAAAVVHHVGAVRHVAADALRGLAASLVMSMRLAVIVLERKTGEGRIACRAVALRADGVAFGDQLSGMGFVAVGTGNPLGFHLGLKEGPENEDLGILLAVTEVKIGS